MPCLYEDQDVCPDPYDTWGHEECWIGMNEDDDAGQTDGQGCANGCRSCQDMPSEVLHDGQTFVSAYLNQFLWGATRFLAPHRNVGMQTATNRRADLRTWEPLLVQAGAAFVLGCCYKNQNEECFSSDPEHSVCVCWGEENGWVVSGSSCPDDGTPQLQQVSGYFADRFFFLGRGWPTRSSIGGLQILPTFGKTAIFCRKFTPFHRCSQVVSVAPLSFGDPSNLVGMFMRSSPRTGLGVVGCMANALAFMAGSAQSSEEGCLDAFCTNIDENDNLYDKYVDSPCDLATQHLAVYPDEVDPVRFAVSSPNFPELDGNMAAIKNNILDMLWTTAFPDPGEPGGTKVFDRLEHTVYAAYPGPMSGLSTFYRGWDAAVLGLPVEELPVVFDMPHSRTRYGECFIDASLVVTRVRFTVVYVPIWLRRQQSIHSLANLLKFWLYPFASTEIIINCGIRINSVSGECRIRRLYLDPADPNYYEDIVITEGAAGTFPTVNPDGNDITYGRTDGEILRPPREVTWRGLVDSVVPLDGAEAQSRQVDRTGANTVEVARRMVKALSGTDGEAAGPVKVGGHPVLYDTNPTEPSQLWQGKLCITFEGTPGYTDCV